jgi:hypothetical protein
MTDAPDLPTKAANRPVGDGSRWPSVRSILIGLMGVTLIAALTPFNNILFENSLLIGGTMPVAVTLVAVLLTAGVNVVLYRVRPQRVLRRHELTVALVMMLVACALPGIGFMAYVPYGLVGLSTQAKDSVATRRLLEDLSLPSWVMPALDADGRDSAISHFYGRASASSGWLDAVPWGAWAGPALGWGLLVILLMGLLLFGAVLIHRQWVENERLPFPVANIYASLLETPPPGRALNRLLSNRSFWIALGAVVLVRFINGAALYDPHVPRIPVAFDYRGLLADTPFRYTNGPFQMSALYFAVIGITYFLQAKIGFSLWSLFVVMQLTQAVVGASGREITPGVKEDQTFGAMLALAGLMVWTGRQHLAMIVRQMLRGRRDGESEGRFLSYRIAGLGFAACVVGLVVWLCAAGATVIGAMLTVGVLLLIQVIVARVAAETGLAYVQLSYSPYRPWLYGASAGLPATSNSSFFWTTFLGFSTAHDTREAAGTYLTHGLKLAHDAESTAPRVRPRAYLAVAAVAVIVSFLVSGSATLVMEYNNAFSLSEKQTTPMNTYGISYVPTEHIAAPTTAYAAGRQRNEVHNNFVHVGAGAAAVTVMGVLRARFEAWPFHPLGLLLVYTFPLGRMWFSIMLGWLAKVVILRLGGSRAFQAAQPFFVGLVVGESLAVSLWLVISMIFVLFGHPYKLVYFTP